MKNLFLVLCLIFLSNISVVNAEFKFDGFSAKITSLNSADEWPRQWVLKRVAFLNTMSVATKEATFSRGPASSGKETMPVVVDF